MPRSWQGFAMVNGSNLKQDLAMIFARSYQDHAKILP